MDNKSPLKNDHFREMVIGLTKIDPNFVKNVGMMLRTLNPDNQYRTNRVWTMGNGGSAATASHFANDLTKACNVPAVCLTDLVPTFTAYSNDDGYEDTLLNMIMDFAKPGDVLVLFSCSGNSQNIVNATLKEEHWDVIPDLDIIAFMGNNHECELAKKKPDYALFADVPSIEAQEDIHMTVCHAIVKEIKSLRYHPTEIKTDGKKEV